MTKRKGGEGAVEDERPSKTRKERTSKEEDFRFDEVELIGRGGFGNVYKAHDKKFHRIVALKLVSLGAGSMGLTGETLREISILRQLNHENVVRLLDVMNPFDGMNVSMVLEWMDMDLRRYLRTYPQYFGCDSSRIKDFLHQILLAIDHCHSRMIFHRDLKPQNILVDEKSNIVKIGDFGLARTFCIPQKECTPELVTVTYRAPDVLRGSTLYYMSADMWSIGCVFAEMVRGVPLFSKDNLDISDDSFCPLDDRAQQLVLIYSVMGTPGNDTFSGITLSDHCGVLDPFDLKLMNEVEPKELTHFVRGLGAAGMDLLSRMLCLDPRRRISAADALNHPFFSEN